jgi:RNA recognition motif-containing protein
MNRSKKFLVLTNNRLWIQRLISERLRTTMALAAPPSAGVSAMEGQRIPPNQSIYLQNLPHKIQKDDLQRELYILFSTYGSVIDITALKSKKMQGQAHILFKDVQSATQAMRACQGFEFFGREMVREAFM